MHGFRLISRHYGALDAILGYIPYLSGSSGLVGLCRQILAEMLSDTLIFRGFITSLLDDMHVILGHILYSSGSSRVCLFVHTVLIERMNLVMTFFGLHHVSVGCHTGAYPPS